MHLLAAVDLHHVDRDRAGLTSRLTSSPSSVRTMMLDNVTVAVWNTPGADSAIVAVLAMVRQRTSRIRR